MQHGMESLKETLNQWIDKEGVRAELEQMMKEDFNHPLVLQFIEENKDHLSQEGVLRSHANIHEFLTQKEKFDKGEATVVPGYYPELVTSKGAIEVSYRPTTDTIRAQQRAQIKSRISTYKMPKNIANVSLAEVDRTPERLPALTAAFQFIEDYKRNPQDFHKGLYLSGAFGVGKTYLVGAMAYELAELGFEVQMVHFPQLVVGMKQSIGDQTTGELLDQVKQTEILLLDDVGAEAISAWVRDDILGVILQYRMQNELSTFFTSNFTMDEFEEHLAHTQKGDHEPLKAKRIMERVRFLANEIVMTGPNRRNP